MGLDRARKIVADSLKESAAVKCIIAETIVDELIEVVDMIVRSFKSGGKLLILGNGGSAADAQHIAAELVWRFYQSEREALPAIALTTDTSIMTAVGNDYGVNRIFSRQVEARDGPDDVVVGISTSGNSPNVLEAMAVARKKGAKTVGLSGKSGGKLGEIVDLIIRVPSSSTPRIQEAHITIGHIICHLVEERMFGYKEETKRQMVKM